MNPRCCASAPLAQKLRFWVFGCDPYWKLRPETVTPPDELCACTDEPPVVLQDHLSSVPLACLRCNGEVPPERLGFSEQLSEELAFWRDFHRAFLILEFDSAEYEEWARAQLENPDAPVNVRGLKAVRKLNEHRRTYLWWFEDTTNDQFCSKSTCPRCGRVLTKSYGRPVCDFCLIVVPNGFIE